MRLLYRRRAEFEIPDQPEFAFETVTVFRLEAFANHADAFFETCRALAGVEAHAIEYPRMAAADADHDSPAREKVGSGELAREYRRVMSRHADDTGKKTNPACLLCRRREKSQGKR